VAEAEATRAEGDAQASAILATGNAEAEAMNKRAAAFARYNEAAVLQMLVEVLPQVAKEIAAPMAGIDNLTVVSTDGAGALPKQVTSNLVQTLELLKTTTGVDIAGLVEKFAGGSQQGRQSARDGGDDGARGSARDGAALTVRTLTGETR
jgi:flotillin